MHTHAKTLAKVCIWRFRSANWWPKTAHTHARTHAHAKTMPKSGQERPKRGQEQPTAGQERPKSSQERPKSDQERPKNGLAWPETEYFITF